MEYRKLGRTGLDVSRLCLGCMSFGDPDWLVHPWVLGRDDAMPFFERAVEAGINFFDTADMYSFGVSEEITGEALGKLLPREEAVIATKLGLSMGKGPNSSGLSRKRIVDCVESSLDRLGTDYIDILYIHRLDPETPMEEIVEGLAQVVGDGSVRYLGASSMYAWQFAKMREMQRAAGCPPFAVMQNFYNLLYREEEREMIPYCASEGVAVVPWSPLARGFLAGNTPKGGEATKRGQRDPRSKDYFGSDTDYEIASVVAAIASERGVSPAQIALAWVLSRGDITAPIVGATKMRHLDDAIAALSLTLEPAEIARLEAPYRPRAIMGHS
ncbi:MAG: aldo/keto reductase [Rhizobiaceae bacterium]|nr:aldo/keto reductase [Rhizobiaceae bacterium]